MSVLHLAAKFGQLKVIDMLWGKTPIEQVSVKVRIRDEYICKRLLFTDRVKPLANERNIVGHCMLLRVVRSCFARFETDQTFEPTTPNISFVP